MLRFISAFAVACVLCTALSSALPFADVSCKLHMILPTGPNTPDFNLDYVKDAPPGTDGWRNNCPKPGNFCKCIGAGLKSDPKVEDAPGGYLITLDIASITFVTRDGGSHTTEGPPVGRTFGENEVMFRIEEFSKDPRLVGYAYDLKGHTVDRQGRVTVFIASRP